MHVSFHRWLLLPLLMILLLVPAPASAQEGIPFDRAIVQLWPEYDQPSMLVLLNVQLPSTVPLPSQVTFLLPGSVDRPYVVAVGQTAQTVTDQGIEYEVQKNSEWLEVTVTANGPAILIEYYDPGLVIQEESRSFTYVWPGNHAVDVFSVSMRVPVDTIGVTTDPEMSEVTSPNSQQTFLEWGTSNLQEGEQVPVQLTYIKKSDRLSIADQPLETGTVDEDTQGRISLSNYLPWILGGLGILLIVVGGLYFWQASKGKLGPRRRHRVRDEESNVGEVYCHQCGKRAQPADRFCRTCGTRLRRET